MKRFIALLIICCAACAATVKFGWNYDAQEQTKLEGFRFYDKGTVLGMTTNLTFTGTFGQGEHTVWVTAVSLAGIESDPSDSVTFWVPTRPTSIAIVITPQ